MLDLKMHTMNLEAALVQMQLLLCSVCCVHAASCVKIFLLGCCKQARSEGRSCDACSACATSAMSQQPPASSGELVCQSSPQLIIFLNSFVKSINE